MFQAIRIAVNRELESLDQLVSGLDRLLAPGGRAAFISFHSLEDRIVKQGLRQLTRGCVCPPGLVQCACGIAPTLSAKGSIVKPSEEELAVNPRSRSAKLRLARRLGAEGTRGS